MNSSIEDLGVEHSEKNLNDSIQRAISNGFTVIRSDPTHLLLDIDSIPSANQLDKVLPIVKANIAILDHEEWMSRNGNTHVRLTLVNPLPAQERFALQAMLGSDPVKEVLSLFRLKIGIQEPCILYKPKNLGS